MLQRIQSVFLLLACLACILTFFFPFAEFFSDLGYYRFTLTGFKHISPEPVAVFSWFFAFPLCLLNSVLIVMTGYILSLYKNRVRQLKLLRISVFINIILVGLIFYYAHSLIEQKLGLSPVYTKSIGIYFPLVSIIFQILANRSIRKDEMLVRSADRLR
ncbi:MAG: DUF4293 domain-containing protein [Bacteroidetes bacterium]|nr:DUF4293 domain-containing protein [Bacteroidota bacterium]